KSKLKLTSDIFLHPSRDTDASWLCEPLQTRRYIYAFSVDVIAIDDDVPDVDAHPELDPVLLGNVSVAFRHPPLNLDGTPQRIHDAGELDQHPVSGGLDDASAMLGNLWVHQLSPVRLELSERAFFVSAH